MNRVGPQLTALGLDVGGDVDTQCAVLALDSSELQVHTVHIGLTAVAAQ